MSINITYFAGPSDNRIFCEYAQSIGLSLLPMLIDQPDIVPSDDPALSPACFLSFLSKERLHPYGNPPGIDDAIDPLVFLLRSYYKPPHLVMGWLQCSNDVPELFKLTKPYFSKLAKWFKDNWPQLREKQFIGPEAQRLLEAGAELAYLPPGVTIEKKVIG